MVRMYIHSRTLFNTVFSPTTDSPTIMSLTYDEPSSSVICISTRSPATVVSWMKDEDIIDESSTDYTLTQTVTNRTTSTYSNVLTIHMGASVVGTYICNVSNELGSDSEEVVILGELMVVSRSSISYTSFYISGITISGLPLTVGQSGNIICMTNIAVNSIELRNQSSSLLIINNVTNLTELQYTIDLVMDDLQGEQFTCIAVSGATTYNETVIIEVQGIKLFSCDSKHIPTPSRGIARGIPVAILYVIPLNFIRGR